MFDRNKCMMIKTKTMINGNRIQKYFGRTFVCLHFPDMTWKHQSSSLNFSNAAQRCFIAFLNKQTLFFKTN